MRKFPKINYFNPVWNTGEVHRIFPCNYFSFQTFLPFYLCKQPHFHLTKKNSALPCQIRQTKYQCNRKWFLWRVETIFSNQLKLFDKIAAVKGTGSPVKWQVKRLPAITFFTLLGFYKMLSLFIDRKKIRPTSLHILLKHKLHGP